MTDVEFRAFWTPTFDDTPKAAIDARLTRSLDHIESPSSIWGTFENEGRACLVAHWLVVEGADKAVVEANDVIHRETATIKIARDPVLLGRQARDPYQRTTFGQRYRFLANRVGIGAVTP